MANEEYLNRIITKIKRDFGEEILNFLMDDQIIEIMLNDDGLLWIEKLGEDMQCVGEMAEHKALAVITSVASYKDTEINSQQAILECELPLDGSRFEAILPPISKKPIFTIRKKAIKIFSFDDYVDAKIITNVQKDLLLKAVSLRQNILVVGGTGSGKTTFANAVLDSISAISPDHRIIIIEDTAELQCKSSNKNYLRVDSNYDMLALLKATMRLRPDRIIVGEVRGGEALSLLKAWNTGHSGGIATVHANSAYAGLTRIEQLISEVSTTSMSTLIAEAINLVLFIQKENGGRALKEILKITGFNKQSGQYLFEKI